MTKKLQRGLSRVVIIHQLGTMDLTDNKSGVMGLWHEQQHAKTRGLNEGTGLVTSGISTQTHAGEKKAPEPRKRTKQLPHQRAAPKSRATYHHGPSQEHQNSVQTLNSKGNIRQIRQPCKIAS